MNEEKELSMRRTVLATVLGTLMLTIFLFAPAIIQETAALSLSQHVACKGVDKSVTPWKPVGVSDKFSTADERVYAFLHLENVEAFAFPQFMWVAPDGASLKGYTHKPYNISQAWVIYTDSLEIKGADRQVGVWKSEVYVGGRIFSTVNFKLQPSLDIVSKTFSPREGEPVFPGDTVTATYELKNTGLTTYEDVKFTLAPLPNQVSLLEATSAKNMKPGTTEKFALKIRFGSEGTYDLKVRLTINEVLIEEATLQVKVSPAPFFQNPIVIGGIIALVAVVLVAAVLIMRRRRPTTTAVPAAPAQPAPPMPGPTKYCLNCGESIPADARHCSKCGAAQQ